MRKSTCEKLCVCDSLEGALVLIHFGGVLSIIQGGNLHDCGRLSSMDKVDIFTSRAERNNLYVTLCYRDLLLLLIGILFCKL